MLSSKKGFEWKKFLKKRWVRIFPLFYLCYIPLYFVDAIFVHKDFLYAGSPWKFFLNYYWDGWLFKICGRRLLYYRRVVFRSIDNHIYLLPFVEKKYLMENLERFFQQY